MVTGLPDTLRPWSEALDLFPRELALSLGPCVTRLAPLLGTRLPDREAGPGEPAGWDGLTRRGSYERLLASEWLLATEVPDEFLRRAAAGEHGFLALASRRPPETRRCVALLGTGPDALGAPRLAHLALLVVLSARAQLDLVSRTHRGLGELPADNFVNHVTVLATPAGIDLRFFHLGSSRGRLVLEGSEQAEVRFAGTTATVRDDRGRVVVFDVDGARVLRNARM